MRIVGLTYRGRLLRESLAVFWGKRRQLPRYAIAFCRMLAAHVREILPVTRPSESESAGKRAAKRRSVDQRRDRPAAWGHRRSSGLSDRLMRVITASQARSSSWG